MGKNQPGSWYIKSLFSLKETPKDAYLNGLTNQRRSAFLIYKPFGMVSQFYSNSKQQRKKRFLGELYDFPDGLMPIGRLDEKSEGLLLLTTSGKMSHFVNSQNIEKEYFALVDGAISDAALDTLQTGVTIGFAGKKYKTKPCKVFRIKESPELPEAEQRIRDDRHGPTSWISITLQEGKFRQVRKMTSAVGYPTLRLVRVRIGGYALDNAMDVGVVRPLEKLIF